MGGVSGGKILNPMTELFMKEDSEAYLELEQIKGVDSTIRQTFAELKDNAKIFVKERLMTHGRQRAESIFSISLDGSDAVADVVSRAIAQDSSMQTLKINIDGNNQCRGHSECDAILMDNARVIAIPSLNALNTNAELIHEAAIGKIANEQITKLMTLGLTKKEAEAEIINGFLR